MKIGIYEITDDYKIRGLITSEQPNGEGEWDPFSEKDVIPFWVVQVNSFDGISKANMDVIGPLIKKHLKDKPDEIYKMKFWTFTFAKSTDDFINDRIQQMVFWGNEAKRKALTVQEIYLTLLEQNVDSVLNEVESVFEIDRGKPDE